MTNFGENMNKACLDCSQSKYGVGDNNYYCHMFRIAPDKLPCAQHDMYKELRNKNGKFILNLIKDEKINQ